ncbi:MAG: FG-GAP repeat domain-containing protein [Planctomycetota bacterium]|jgi:hypothetical protein
MQSLLILSTLLITPGQAPFERHTIASYRAGYQVAVADVNADGKPDVIALSTQENRVDWFANPGWERRPVARTAKNIDLAVADVDGDGRPEIALASEFHFADGDRGGHLHLLFPPRGLEDPWPMQPIAVDPVVHRLRWGDLDGDGEVELVHAPIFGPGSRGPADAKPSHLWAFRPRSLVEADWETWKIDETLTVLHGLYVGDLDDDGRAEILTASFEGIYRFDFSGARPGGGWQKTHVAPGASPADPKPGTPRGTSEVVPLRLQQGRLALAAIEPWHGNQVVVYTSAGPNGPWRRAVVDETLDEGHALVAADFDGDGADEIIAGWRRGEGGLALYDPADATGERFAKVRIDAGFMVEGAAVADMNLDGKPDLVAVGSRSNDLAWYENLNR